VGGGVWHVGERRPAWRPDGPTARVDRHRTRRPNFGSDVHQCCNCWPSIGRMSC